MNIIFSDGTQLRDYVEPSKSFRMFRCRSCGKDFMGGEFILGEFYCPMCASIIRANNARSRESSCIKIADLIPECCKKCSNRPSNGGSGICHCILGQKTIY